jgi:hypothetical protein
MREWRQACDSLDAAARANLRLSAFGLVCESISTLIVFSSSTVACQLSVQRGFYYSPLLRDTWTRLALAFAKPLQKPKQSLAIRIKILYRHKEPSH